MAWGDAEGKASGGRGIQDHTPAPWSKLAVSHLLIVHTHSSRFHTPIL